MHHFAVYEISTGVVVKVGRGSNPAVVTLAEERMKPGQAIYLGEIDPAETYMPGGIPTPKPAAPKIVTAVEVKAHAGRLLSYTDWVVVKALDTGVPANADILAQRQAIRAASNEIEAMDPIPADFMDPKYWTTP